jgi:glutathione synthase/RimK-type ligase-like ATP-grasp enzyme
LKTEKTFLLLTHSHDFYCIDLVADHLRKQGYDSVRMNTDHFPGKYGFTWNFANERKGFTLTIGKKTITSEQVAAVWIRKALFPPPDETIDPAYRHVVANENSEIVRSFLTHLGSYPSLDPYDLLDRAESKPLQQNYAIECGITIPPSIIGNSLKEAKAFMQKGKTYITKLLRPIGWSMGGDSNFFYTSFIKKSDLAADHFAAHPVLIQEFVPKKYELRVAYVGGEFFAGKLAVEEFEVDWRIPGKNGEWSAYKLPAAECKKLHRMMKMLGLNFGAIDIIRGTDNKYYFLEVNPIGEWGMLEKFTGLPISEAIAKHLIKIAKHEK